MNAMDKWTISVGGAEFVCRTIDIRRVPGFSDECYASVSVAAHGLWDAIDQAVMAGDKDAEAIDDKFIFYIDDDLMERNATDEELCDYLAKYMS